MIRTLTNVCVVTILSWHVGFAKSNPIEDRMGSRKTEVSSSVAQEDSRSADPARSHDAGSPVYRASGGACSIPSCRPARAVAPTADPVGIGDAGSPVYRAGHVPGTKPRRSFASRMRGELSAA